MGPMSHCSKKSVFKSLHFCMSALGMESGEIRNSSINATSSHVNFLGPSNARLNREVGGGGWCPKVQIEPGVREYMQVNLERPHLVTAVATQGRYHSGRGQEYTEEYTVEYWRPGMTKWQQYSRWDDKMIFGGNSDTTTVVQQQLTPPVHATNVRIVPYSPMLRTVCMRIELYGCLDENDGRCACCNLPIWSLLYPAYFLSQHALHSCVPTQLCTINVLELCIGGSQPFNYCISNYKVLLCIVRDPNERPKSLHSIYSTNPEVHTEPPLTPELFDLLFVPPYKGQNLKVIRIEGLLVNVEEGSDVKFIVNVTLQNKLYKICGSVNIGGLLSYSAPDPSAEKGDHVDKKYDGWKDSSGNIVGGLGVLTDGQVGGDFFSLDLGFAKGNGWVAWKNSSFEDNYMEIGFEFNAIKNISQIKLFANNYYSRDVQIFSTAVVFFSIGGRYFNGEPVVHFEKEDKASQKARNVTIDIQGGRLAKFIRIRLYFASEWLMLSEVYFNAETVNVSIAEETEQKSFEHLLENSIFISDVDRRLTASRSTSIIVILSVLISVLLLIFVPIVFLKKNHKYSSQNTASILKNTLNINIKDLFSNLAPAASETGEIRTEQPRTGRMSQGRRAAAAESQNAYYPNGVANNSVSMSSTHSQMGGYESSRNEQMGHGTPNHSANADLASGFGHGYLELDLDPDRLSAYELGYQPPMPTYSLDHTSSRPMLVTAVSPESLRSRAIVSLAPTKCSFNHNNLPNILQDGIHIDCLNDSEDGPLDYYRVVPSNSRDDVPVQRFMTLSSAMKKPADEDDDDDAARFSVFSSKTQGREKYSKNLQHDNRIDNNDKTFSLSDLKKLHGRCSTTSKDTGAITIWNISPAFRRSFPEVEVDFNAIPITSLRLILKIGTLGSQEISIYETKNSKPISPGTSRIVQLKTVKMTRKDASFREYLEELKYLGSMDHPSLSRLVGLVTTQNPPLAVFEYTHAGDLYQYLRKSNNPDYIRFPVFLSIILQICSAMKYLEAREAVHKDLAARNILMFPGNKIKVTDTAMYSPLYSEHYYIQEGAKPLPIRWLSWECTLLKRYTCPGTVWSFAITIWEIFDLCQHFPYENLSIKDIVKLAEDHLLKQEINEIHPRPPLCPEDIYKLMLNCWERKSKNRPTFNEIYNFLKSKYIDLVPIDDHF
ncbi:discoidin domain-containing receptor tyrosine kinase B-like [Arctopsyche grandis]|uniref:discoidin domain-containing receptor tyrosine kinase B-like n=1 Tax=Arctopsyche grandis TaxID=121162 RepID=UPI00406DA439